MKQLASRLTRSTSLSLLLASSIGSSPSTAQGGEFATSTSLASDPVITAVIDGASISDFGTDVASLGDLDGDGIDELAIGETLRPGAGQLLSGGVHIVYFNADGTARKVVTHDPRTGAFAASRDADMIGAAVSAIGDVDGNGVPDLAVGAPFADGAGANRGEVWILFLRADGSLIGETCIGDGTGGFTGVLRDSDSFGTGLGSLPDLDGDGIDELVVGARGDDDAGVNAGAIWILRLDVGGAVTQHTKVTTGSGGLAGVLDPAGNFGDDVAHVGDIDGDGLPELAVGAPLDSTVGTKRGAVWLLFMDANGLVRSELQLLDNGSLPALADSDWFGSAVAAAGDLDGNGVPDLLVGAQQNDTDLGVGTGALWSLLLDSSGAPIGGAEAEPFPPVTPPEFRAGGSGLGRSVAVVGGLGTAAAPFVAIGARNRDDVLLAELCDGDPSADFTASDTVVTPGKVVQFLDQSIGTNITSWAWDFGDGATSTLRNPFHTYSEFFFYPQTYSVSLTVTGADGTCSKLAEDLILLVECASDPAADFDATPSIGTTPLTVAFTDLSTGTGIHSWEWDFGDGATSTLQNPTHIYTQEGTYDVELRLVGALGTCRIERKDHIVVGPCASDPVPAFVALPTTGIAPLPVSFFDLSLGTGINAWFWDFGDGRTSIEQNPVHVYEDSGTYDVTLTITGAFATCSLTQVGLVQVDNCGSDPVSGLTAAPSSGNAPLAVAFTDRSSGTNIYSWQWDFGDGLTSTLQNPIHVYQEPGTYDVSLFVEGDNGRCLNVWEDLIRVASDCTDPFADFVPSAFVGLDPLTVSFTNLSSGSFSLNFAWDFGDGEASTERDPVHVYDEPGTYTVSLLATDGIGACLERRTDLILVYPGDKATTTPRNGLGINPDVLRDLAPPLLGQVWTGELDAAAAGATGFAFLYAYEDPGSGTVLPAFGELLVDPLSPQLFFRIGQIANGVAQFQVGVPLEAELIGFELSAQAFINGIGKLTNALDLVLGT